MHCGAGLCRSEIKAAPLRSAAAGIRAMAAGSLGNGRRWPAFDPRVRARVVPQALSRSALTGRWRGRCWRLSASPAQYQKGDVIPRVLTSDQGAHDRDTDVLGRPGRDGPA
jgi:hypothetical protein